MSATPDPDLYVLEHRTCGHISAMANVRGEGNRSRIEAQQRLSAAAGFHGWRVRRAKGTEELMLRYLTGPCEVCRMEPQLVDQAGLAAAMATDVGVRNAAAIGAGLAAGGGVVQLDPEGE